jgi:hypothetical protein
LLDEGATKGVVESLDRARTIVETLHLLPPSPLLLRFWVIEGRFFALEDNPESARDRWLAVADEPTNSGLPRPRSEALLRLALLEFARKRPEDALPYTQRLAVPAVLGALPVTWQDLVPDLGDLAAQSKHGGTRLPPPDTLSRRRDPQRRERAGAQSVQDR